MEEDIYRSQFRLPYSLYELLKASADHNHRSVNAELIARLESTFKKMDRVRMHLGLPFAAEDEASEDEALEERKRLGARQNELMEKKLHGMGIKREDIMEAVTGAVVSALSGLGAFPELENDDQPEPGLGLKPRKPNKK